MCFYNHLIYLPKINKHIKCCIYYNYICDDYIKYINKYNLYLIQIKIYNYTKFNLKNF